MKTYLCTAIFALVSLVSLAQTKTITGKVSESLRPLPAANVIVKGTSTGVQTDFDGNYTIQATPEDILVFSYVGYRTEQIKVKNKNIINVLLESDNTLDEVVVIGYGIKREKKALGYAVSEVRAESIENKKESDIARVLSGKANGVFVGQPGAATHIKIRGNNSLSGFKRLEEIRKQSRTQNGSASQITDVFYIVDGVAIDPSLNAVIESIDTKSIERINTYEPLRASELFGNIGGKQCTIITTKRGNYRIENEESYKEIFENSFKSVSYDPLSTFSIDVDRASYSNVRRFINNGQDIPFDAVKVEEMINYFDYEYQCPNDNKPFAVHTEVIQTPWNKETLLMKVGLKGKEIEIKELPASNLTFLIDVSGSMSAQNKLPLLKSAFEVLVNNLRKEDRVSIVVYAGAAGVVLKPTSGKNKEKILNALNNLNAGGSTAGGEGIELAYKLAQENFKKNGNNRVVLATDGDFNVGASSDKAMENLIEEKRKSGVFLTCLGFGMGNYKDSKLETLADKGNGNYAYIDTMQEAHKFLVKEFSGTLFTIAKDVKIQVEFNPSAIKSYRLIGYENRLLANEDFKDDAKDAGEIGAGHTVTALYEVVPQKAAYNPIQDESLKYQNTVSENLDELLTVKIRYKEPDGEKSMLIEEPVFNKVADNASPDFKFISAVAMFGMQLRESKYVDHISKNELIALAKLGRGADTDGFRAEFIRLVKAK